MQKRFCTIFLLLILLLQSVSSAAATGAQPSVVFRASAPDQNGCFEVVFCVYDASFNAFQFALSYNTAAMRPVKSDASPATTFRQFASTSESAGWLSSVGTALDTDGGLIRFAGYVTPGTWADCIKDGCVVADGSGVDLLVFRFQLLDADAAWLKLATEQSGAVYDPSVPDGGGLAAAGGRLEASVSFDLSALASEPTQSGAAGDLPATDDEEEETSPDTSEESGGTAQLTAQQLLSQSIILRLDSHAAVVFGGVAAIYPGEREVCAYLNGDNRTMIPVRFVAEKLGAVVEWENRTRTVVIRLKSKTIRMPVGSRVYSVNDQTWEMDTTAIILHDRTLVPVRFAAEALGYQVEYDPLYRMVILSPYAWDMDSQSARTALNDALSMLLMFGNFV